MMNYNDNNNLNWNNNMSDDSTTMLPLTESYATIPGMMSTAVEIPLFLVG